MRKTTRIRRSGPGRSFTHVTLFGALSVGCADGTGEVPSGLDVPRTQIERRYTVAVDVLETGEGCVIGGLTPGGEIAEALPEQSGASVRWYQTGESGGGLRWVLAGHVCPGAEDPDAAGAGAMGETIRLYGGRNTLQGDGDDAVCQVDLALPTGHIGGSRTRNRCEDDRCSTIELVSDGCGGWVADFEARLSYARQCVDQPACVMRMRWHATPDGSDEGCTPDLTAGGGAWMADCRTLP